MQSLKQTAEGNVDDEGMSLSEHLSELRKCIATVVIVFVMISLAAYFYAPVFVRYALSIASGYQFIQTGVAELLGQYVKVALIVGVVGTLPVMIWQVDRFLRPGLNRNEHTILLLIMISGMLLFFCGAAFCFGVVIPFTLQFFLSLNTIGIEGLYSIKEYISYIVAFMVAFGAIFEIPVITALLSGIGVLRPRLMISGQRIIFVLCFFIGAVITPPDVSSQILVAVPMIVLYETSILICKAVCSWKEKHAISVGTHQVKMGENVGKSRWAMARERIDQSEGTMNQ